MTVEVGISMDAEFSHAFPSEGKSLHFPSRDTSPSVCCCVRSPLTGTQMCLMLQEPSVLPGYLSKIIQEQDYLSAAIHPDSGRLAIAYDKTLH